MHRVDSRRRVIAAIALAVVVATGLAVHTLLADSAATDIAGDALYAIAAYLFVVLVAPRLSPVVTGAVAAAWCVAVELFQLTGIPLSLGAVFSPAMLVLGTVFDARDLVVYIVAVGVTTMTDAAIRARGNRRRQAR
ncbi:DUF2809 domain-containing protein [Planococcus sp. APC 4015]|nr:DUF2809 domain-containing protein [Planococcus sp. APC 4015]